MEIQWIVIASDTNLSSLYLLQNLLSLHSIPTQILNKMDSVYPSIGEAELYIDSAYRIKALQLIHDSKSESDNDEHE